MKSCKKSPQSQRRSNRRARGSSASEFVRIPDAAEMLGMGPTKMNSIHDTDPSFPRKIRLGPRCVGFMRRDLIAWLELKARQAAGN